MEEKLRIWGWRRRRRIVPYETLRILSWSPDERGREGVNWPCGAWAGVCHSYGITHVVLSPLKGPYNPFNALNPQSTNTIKRAVCHKSHTNEQSVVRVSYKSFTLRSLSTQAAGAQLKKPQA
eukprot:1186523-Prorocentrum_minimum.AAC.1